GRASRRGADHDREPARRPHLCGGRSAHSPGQELVMSGIVVGAEELRVRSRRLRSFAFVIPVCFVIVGAILVCAVFGQLIAPHSATAQELGHALAKPSGDHPFGTDTLGRDVLSRVIVGARTALIGPLVITCASMLIGSILGLLAGYRGGRVDSAVMR